MPLTMFAMFCTGMMSSCTLEDFSVVLFLLGAL